MNKRYFLSLLVFTAAVVVGCHSRRDTSCDTLERVSLTSETSQVHVSDSLDPELDVPFRVERMPAYPGCETLSAEQVGGCTTGKVEQFIAQTVRYPALAIAQDLQGVVYVYYEIDQAGDVVNIKVRRGVHKLLDQAAIKAVKKLPKHQPGTQDGKAVRVMYTLPVSFRIK